MTVVTYLDPLAVDRDGKEFAGDAQLAFECCEPVCENQRIVLPSAEDAPVCQPLAVFRIHPGVKLLAISVDHPELTVPDDPFVPAVGTCRPNALAERRLRGGLSFLLRRRFLLGDRRWGRFRWNRDGTAADYSGHSVHGYVHREVSCRKQ